MKIGRNDQCPCGSGKKYKKCCLLKDQTTTMVSNQQTQSIQNDDEDLSFDAQDFLHSTLNSLHELALSKKPHIQEYKRIRKLHGEIGDSMLDYYYSGKFEQKVDAEYAMKHRSENIIEEKNIVLLQCNFDFDTEIGMKAFQDMVMYKPALNMNCITEEFIKKNRYRKPEKVEFLHAMLDSKLGLFKVTKTDWNEGYVHMKEVFTGNEYKIIDIAMSGNEYFTEYYIYTRIITYHDICFGSGFNMVFDKKDPFIQNYITHHKKDYHPNGDFARFIELHNHYSKDDNSIKTVTMTYN